MRRKHETVKTVSRSMQEAKKRSLAHISRHLQIYDKQLDKKADLEVNNQTSWFHTHTFRCNYVTQTFFTPILPIITRILCGPQVVYDICSHLSSNLDIFMLVFIIILL